MPLYMKTLFTIHFFFFFVHRSLYDCMWMHKMIVTTIMFTRTGIRKKKNQSAPRQFCVASHKQNIKFTRLHMRFSTKLNAYTVLRILVWMCLRHCIKKYIKGKTTINRSVGLNTIPA